jgi:hypothetical protein
MLGGRATWILWLCMTIAFLVSANWNRRILSSVVNNNIGNQTSSYLSETNHGFSTNGSNFMTVHHQPKWSENRTEDTTIIITSSLIPTHPSLDIIDRTLESLKYLTGLSEHTPIIIAVDGMHDHDKRRYPSKARRLSLYVDALKQKYTRDAAPSFRSSDNSNGPKHLRNIRVLSQSKRLNLNGNVKRALNRVHTEFMYVIQHDIPFIHEVNHTALVRTFREYPETIRLVRFSTKKVLERDEERQGLCGEQGKFSTGDVKLSKTHIWSDR